jgi:NADH:ubiquinone oxidoreductase subunit 3 (subunit A)
VKDDIYTYPALQWVRTIALGVFIFVACTYVGYRINVYEESQVVRDDYDHYHEMVILPLLVGFVSGVVLGMVAMILDRRHQRRKRLAIIEGYTAPAPARARKRRTRHST